MGQEPLPPLPPELRRLRCRRRWFSRDVAGPSPYPDAERLSPGRQAPWPPDQECWFQAAIARPHKESSSVTTPASAGCISPVWRGASPQTATPVGGEYCHGRVFPSLFAGQSCRPSAAGQEEIHFQEQDRGPTLPTCP